MRRGAETARASGESTHEKTQQVLSLKCRCATLSARARAGATCHDAARRSRHAPAEIKARRAGAPHNGHARVLHASSLGPPSARTRFFRTSQNQPWNQPQQYAALPSPCVQ